MKDTSNIKRIRQGDIKAFEQLFREYYEKLCQWAHQYLHDKDSSEEVVQDLFYQIWANRESIEFRISVKSYLYKSVSNNCKMILRQKSRRAEIESELARDLTGIEEPADLPGDQELSEVIGKTLDELPDSTATIFKMSRFDGMKYREIANHLKISVKTVEANMGKALSLFRKNLKEYINK